MSYILDALKKSEQQRLAGGVPNLHSGQPLAIESASPQRNWLIPALIILAINAAAIGSWLAMRPATILRSPLPPEIAPPSPPPRVPAPADSGAAQPAPGAAAVQAPTGHYAEPAAPIPAPRLAPGHADHNPTASPPPRGEAPGAATSPPRDPIPSKPAVRNAPPAAATVPSPEPDHPSATPPRGGVVAYADLPASIRNAMPPLKIGGYIDGDGEAMLVVDDRLVHEGDEIGPGVRVLKISPDGAVFGFRSHRFRR